MLWATMLSSSLLLDIVTSVASIEDLVEMMR